VTDPVVDLASGKHFDAHQSSAISLDPGAARILMTPDA